MSATKPRSSSRRRPPEVLSEAEAIARRRSGLHPRSSRRRPAGRPGRRSARRSLTGRRRSTASIPGGDPDQRDPRRARAHVAGGHRPLPPRRRADARDRHDPRPALGRRVARYEPAADFRRREGQGRLSQALRSPYSAPEQRRQGRGQPGSVNWLTQGLSPAGRRPQRTADRRTREVSTALTAHFAPADEAVRRLASERGS